jgi:hypothetical protein
MGWDVIGHPVTVYACRLGRLSGVPYGASLTPRASRLTPYLPYHTYLALPRKTENKQTRLRPGRDLGGEIQQALEIAACRDVPLGYYAIDPLPSCRR